MMKRATNYKILQFIVILIFIGITVGACSNFSKSKSEHLLQQAKNLMETHPDSAMSIIDSIESPQVSLSHENYMYYLIARVEAYYKNFRPIDEDTLIFQARDYFAKLENKIPETALAYYYSGCVYREQQKYDKAMQEYKIAEEYAERISDANLQGLIVYNIGDLLRLQGLYLQALNMYRDAAAIYVNYPERQIQCLSAIGQMYLLLEKPNDAIVAFNQGLELAQKIDSPSLQSLLFQNIGVTYKEIEKYDEAEKYLRLSYSFNSDSLERPRYYLNFADLYAKMGKRDSVTIYIQNLKYSLTQIQDPYLKVGILQSLVESEKSSGNYDEAINYLYAYANEIENITETRMQQAVYEVQQKYNLEKARSTHQQQVAVYKNWIFSLLGIGLISGIVFLSYSLSQKKKLIRMYETIDTLRKISANQKILRKAHGEEIEKKLADKINDYKLLEDDFIRKKEDLTQQQKENEQLKKQVANNNDMILKEREQDLLQKTNELIELHAQNSRKKNETLRNALLWQFGVISKVADLDKIEKDDSGNLVKEFKKIIYKGDFENHYQMIVSFFNRFDEKIILKIREFIPNIKEQELLVCLLTYVGLSVKETSSLLPLTQNTIQSYRRNLRRSLNIEDNTIDTATFLRNILDN